jgi:hypothetical protein
MELKTFDNQIIPEILAAPLIIPVSGKKSTISPQEIINFTLPKSVHSLISSYNLFHYVLFNPMNRSKMRKIASLDLLY